MPTDPTIVVSNLLIAQLHISAIKVRCLFTIDASVYPQKRGPHVEAYFVCTFA